MKSKNALYGLSMSVVLRFGVLASSAQTNIYLFSGSETNITLNPGTYIIPAYGAAGGYAYADYLGLGGLGAEMSAEFDFSTSTTLTLVVGFMGDYFSQIGYDYCGGGGGAVNRDLSPGIADGGNGNVGGSVVSYGGIGYGGGGGGYSGGGGGSSSGDIGGGGSIIDSSAIAILTEVSGIYSSDGGGSGEIIITAVPTPVAITSTAALGFTNGVFCFDVSGPSGSNVVIQASTDLQTWIPLQTNLLGSGPLHLSDA